jgi:hypothetical protein
MIDGDEDFQDDDELTEIAERLQVGDTAEGAEALGRLLKKVGGQRDIGSEVRRVQAHDRVQAEIRDGLDPFSKKYPSIAKDDVLSDAGMRVLRREIKKDLEAAGVPAEKIEPFENSNEHMVAAYAHLRAGGRPVRSPSELLDAAGEDLRKRFNIRGAPTRNPHEILREMRTQRRFSNDPEHIGTDVPGGAVEDEHEKKRRERDRQHMEKRVARHDNMRSGVSNQDTY